MTSNPQSLLSRIIAEKNIINERYENPSELIQGKEKGCFSFIVKAFDRTTHQPVIIKFFDPIDLYKNDDYRRISFIREIEILNSFKTQRNIIQIIEGPCTFSEILKIELYGEQKIEFPFYVMECALSNINDYIYSSNNNARLSLIYFREICKGVQRLHSSVHYHRDLKPSNCFIFKNSCVKIGDFGTACSRRDTDTDRLKDKYDHPVGDKRFSGLELFCGLGDIKEVIAASDMFSLGVILFEMFTRDELYTLVYDEDYLFHLMHYFSKIPPTNRLKEFEKRIPHIKSKWFLPEIDSFGNSDLLPSVIKDRVNNLYKVLCDLDYRKRPKLAHFPSIFLRLDACIKILERIEQYKKWQLEKQKRKLQDEQRRLKGENK